LKILEDLIAALDSNASVRDIRQGVFHTAVLSRQCGLAATLPRDALKQEAPLVRKAGTLLSMSAQELVRMVHSEHILEAAIGMAAINSLIQIDEAACVELNAAEVIIEKGQGKRVAVVGHFPFLPRVREKAETLWVIEKNPKEGDLTEAEAESVIPQAHVVALTGTSLTNHTLGHLLALCDSKAYVLMLGDTVPLSPVLFDYGVDALSGTKVVDADLALACVSQGANFRQIKGTKRLTMFKR
jgi:uncharacterized protein (DUF4213/DUF364 family)